MRRSGGLVGIQNLSALESAVEQPRMTFGGEELYPTLVEKAAAIGFAIIQNHPFTDGNKRTGHEVMVAFLGLNGFEIDASVDEQEQIILQVASGTLNREKFTNWLRTHVIERKGS